MKSVRTRITVWYAFSATATMAVLFLAGYLLLQNYIFRNLDVLNRTEFDEIRARLGTDYRTLPPAVLDKRIRETTNFASVLFYININAPPNNILFYSNNLEGRPIPDVPGRHVYNVEMPGIGGLRVAEFILPPFDVTVGTPTRQTRQVMDAYVEICLALMVATLLANIAIGAAISRPMLRPVRLIGETANRIRSDNLGERIPVPEIEDEIADLARLLNQMFDRLELAFDQSRQFAAEVSHELKTPLSLVRLHAEKMLTDGGMQSVHEEAIVVQLEELERINQMIDELLFISRAEVRGVKLHLVAQSPDEFLRDIEPDLQALIEHRGVDLDISHAGEGQVAIEAKWLRQVVFNLLTNALRVSPRAGRITVRSTIGTGRWMVSIEDEGPGLTEEQCERVFDRFVRFNVHNDEDRGSGLGLAICRSILNLHGGRIGARPRRDRQGLEVCLELPVLNAETA